MTEQIKILGIACEVHDHEQGRFVGGGRDGIDLLTWDLPTIASACKPAPGALSIATPTEAFGASVTIYGLESHQFSGRGPTREGAALAAIKRALDALTTLRDYEAKLCDLSDGLFKPHAEAV